MFFFIPIGHEEAKVRRLPLVTLALILANILFYVLTISTIRHQENELAKIRMQLEALKTKAFIEIESGEKGPFTGLTEIISKLNARNIADLNQKFKDQLSGFWEDFTAGKKVPKDHPLYVEYLNLKTELDANFAISILGRYAIIPNQFVPFTSITYSFLHGSASHVIFNMLFLYLTGAVVEDVFGGIFLLILYMASGFAAGLTHVLFNMNAALPCIGASGSVAGLMGAFLLRFYKVKIHFLYFLFVVFAFFRGVIALPAFFVLPIWFLIQLIYGISELGLYSNIAYMAHVGGFASGLVIMAIGMLMFAKKQTVTEEENIEGEKAILRARSSPMDLLEAQKLINEGKLTDGKEKLIKILQAKPTHSSAKLALIEAHLADGNHKEAEVLAKNLVEQLLASENLPMIRDIARMFIGLKASHGIPDRVLFEIARSYDERMEYDDAVLFYDELANRYPQSPLTPKSLLQAAKLTSRFIHDREGSKKRLLFLIENFPNHPLSLDAKREIKSAEESGKANF